MQFRAPAIFIAARFHGETAVIARLLTRDRGVVAAYIAGGRGRHLRPVVIPGNLVECQFSFRSENQLPFGKLELLQSRGPWLGEPLPAAAMGWVCALTATVLPERQSYPSLFDALSALLDAICHAPSARGWVDALCAYERLMLRELGYGGQAEQKLTATGDLAASLAIMERQGGAIGHYLLADRFGDVMAARTRLIERLGRMI
ncbi:DNA repair protein RecO [Altericroceibacterium endophyticum]|uniref:DNA repair protein RecO n=1 Tax=Altericroceibacterium endophyticum TaxID=1808508 RepID=A0A6I4T5I1_9SPHN|nr:recombination protein O N-terminal domain-containing protein [Altericroceibacterium endophyticum]MXO66136.1 DNA recombination protein RecO [Altericroceibacterium endophyticum]